MATHPSGAVALLSPDRTPAIDPRDPRTLVEPGLGLLSDIGWRRSVVLGGGVTFILALFGTAAAPDFAFLLAATCVLFPASGAFVSLAQATWMDLEPASTEGNMARWVIAGSVGGIVGRSSSSASSDSDPAGAGNGGRWAADGSRPAVRASSSLPAAPPRHGASPCGGPRCDRRAAGAPSAGGGSRWCSSRTSWAMCSWDSRPCIWSTWGVPHPGSLRRCRGPVRGLAAR